MRGWLVRLLEKLGRLSCVDMPWGEGKRLLYCVNTGCAVEIEAGAGDPTEPSRTRSSPSDFWLPLC